MWPLDFSNAYKTIGLNEAPNDVSHIFLPNPTNKRFYKARVLVQPFSSRRAPENSDRVVTSPQFGAGGILHVPTGAFVDDVFRAESHRPAMSGFRASEQLCDLIGFPTSEKKARPPSTGMVLLVEDVSLRSTHIQAQVREDRHARPKENIL